MTKPHRKGSTRKMKRGTRRRSRATHRNHRNHRTHRTRHLQTRNDENNHPEQRLHSLTSSSKDNRAHISNLIISNLSNKKKGTRGHSNYRYFSEGSKFN
jgi:hypothetical protein